MLRILVAALALGTAPGWHDTVEIAAGRGEKGPWRQNASHYDYVDDATVAFAPGGQLVAWAGQGGKDVWLRAVSDAGKPGPPVNVSRSPATFSWLPRIAVDPRQASHLYLLWQEIIFSGGSHGGDILFARSRDGGRTFSEPLNLSRSRGGDGKGRLSRDVWSNGSLDLVAANDGSLVAAWTEYDGALWVARSVDGGAGFAAPRRIAGDARLPARAPALAAGPGATVHLAWTVGEDPAARIRVARSLDGGASFGTPQLAGGEGRADAPALAVDGAGRLHLAYALHPPGRRAEVRYARLDAGGFGPARTVSASGAAYPMLAGDGKAGLVLAWENLGPAGRPLSLGMAVSRDAGRSFSAPATVPGSAAPAGGSNGSQQGLLGRKLAVDGAGRIALVNSSLVPGEGSRVWLMRGARP
ncbi:sialidase family protein [Massilia suwonensis]|uniref:Sialidase family protein n=1 Tax=Massilia suwonensis TaxID=648895 RepID=A0ABW0MLC2_9BURK